MPRDTGRMSAGFILSLCLSIVAIAATAFAASPASDSKTDCSKQTASGKKSKDCDTISPDRMSTKEKADQQTTSDASDKTSSKSSSKASYKSKKASNKEADAVSKDRMSTRGLKPPGKEATDDKADPKSSSSSDSSNPK